jgi:hypothetical protein
MAFGPGIYDSLCTYVRGAAHAKGAIVIIIDGDLGSGFSAQLPPLESLQIPDILERMARQIREGAR